MIIITEKWYSMFQLKRNQAVIRILSIHAKLEMVKITVTRGTLNSN